MPHLRRVERVRDLHGDWDGLASSLFQRRAWLAHTERTHPSRLRCVELRSGGRLLAGLISHRVPSERGGRWLPKRYLNAPGCTHAGLIGPPDAQRELLDRWLRRRLAPTVGVHLPDPAPAPCWLTTAAAQPPFVLALPTSWSAYVDALRSDYRRRLRRTQQAFVGELRDDPPLAYSQEHHALYLRARRGWVEPAFAPPFFSELPAPFRLVSVRSAGRLVAWFTFVVDGEEGHLHRVALDPSWAKAHDGYPNLLLDVLRRALDAGCERLDLGPTTATSKQRLGARPLPQRMFVWVGTAAASSWLTRRLGAAAPVEAPRVFRG